MNGNIEISDSFLDWTHNEIEALNCESDNLQKYGSAKKQLRNFERQHHFRRLRTQYTDVE